MPRFKERQPYLLDGSEGLIGSILSDRVNEETESHIAMTSKTSSIGMLKDRSRPK